MCGKVVEHQPAHRDLLDVEHAGRFREMLQRRVIRMESERDERLEATRFILQRSQLEQMVDAVFVILNVAIEHGRVGLQTDLVRQLRSFQPLTAVNLVIANDMPHTVGEDFSPATGERVHSGSLQLFERLANRELGPPRQIGDLHHGERFQVNLRKALLSGRNIDRGNTGTAGRDEVPRQCGIP